MTAKRVELRPSFSRIPEAPAPLAFSASRATQSVYGSRGLEGSGYFRAGNVAAVAARTPEQTVVVVPGSRQVKIGLATDAFPSLHPHVVALRSSIISKSPDATGGALLDESDWEDRLAVRLAAMADSPTSAAEHIAAVKAANAAAPVESVAVHNDLHAVEWIDCGNEHRYFGSTALRVADPSYTRFWPMRAGRIAPFGQSKAAGVALMVETWVALIRLEHPQMKRFHLLLAVPSAWGRSDLVSVTDALVRSGSVASVHLIQEEVACTFGAGISSGIVVDLGAQRLAVACVEDGVVLPETRISVPVGFAALARLLADCLFMSAADDDESLEELARGALTLAEEDVSLMATFEVVRRDPRMPRAVGCEIRRVRASHERILVPLSLFEPGLALLSRYARGDTAACTVDGELLPEFYQADESAPAEPPPASSVYRCPECPSGSGRSREDLVEHLVRVHKQDARCPACTAPNTGDLAWEVHLVNHVNDRVSPPSARRPEPTDSALLSLDEAIAASLERLPEAPPNVDPEARKARLRSSVLVCGGGSGLARLLPFLQSRLNANSSSTGNSGSSSWSVVLTTKDLDPRMVAWKGASVLARLETQHTAEQWIAAREWAEMGERCFFERLSFRPPLVSHQ